MKKSPPLPSLGDSGFKIGNPILGNAHASTLVPPKLLPSEYGAALRQAAETFANRRPARVGQIVPISRMMGAAELARRAVGLLLRRKWILTSLSPIQIAYIQTT